MGTISINNIDCGGSCETNNDCNSGCLCSNGGVPGTTGYCTGGTAKAIHRTPPLLNGGTMTGVEHVTISKDRFVVESTSLEYIIHKISLHYKLLGINPETIGKEIMHTADILHKFNHDIPSWNRLSLYEQQTLFPDRTSKYIPGVDPPVGKKKNMCKKCDGAYVGGCVGGGCLECYIVYYKWKKRF